MIRLAYRNLFQNKIRLVISVGGVALALLLILSLDAIFTGVERQITAYIDFSGADIFVSQSGVRNLHMASSSLPSSVENQVMAVKGVEAVTPILYLTNMIVVDDKSDPPGSSSRTEPGLYYRSSGGRRNGGTMEGRRWARHSWERRNGDRSACC